jgi:hypothetical protein
MKEYVLQRVNITALYHMTVTWVGGPYERYVASWSIGKVRGRLVHMTTTGLVGPITDTWLGGPYNRYEVRWSIKQV